MNLKEEYERARAHLLLDKKSGLENWLRHTESGISVFETNIPFEKKSGLLSIYDLTSDEKFLKERYKLKMLLHQRLIQIVEFNPRWMVILNKVSVY